MVHRCYAALARASRCLVLSWSWCCGSLLTVSWPRSTGTTSMERCTCGWLACSDKHSTLIAVLHMRSLCLYGHGSPPNTHSCGTLRGGRVYNRTLANIFFSPNRSINPTATP